MGERCWNCDSPSYVNAMSYERCDSCGIACYYHGSGSNRKYQDAKDAMDHRQELANEEAYEKYRLENYPTEDERAYQELIAQQELEDQKYHDDYYGRDHS